MDTIEMIQNALTNFIEGIQIIPCCDGGIEVEVEDTADIPAVLSTVADVMYDHGCDDVTIVTRQPKYKVYINVLDREDDDEEA